MSNATLMTDAVLTEDDNIFCDGCGVVLSDAELDECGFLCTRCFEKTHSTCCDCGDTFDNDEASTKCSRRCQTCQESKDEEELEAKKDALKDEARELLEGLCDDGSLDQLRKAVAALKRLQAK